MATSSSKPKPEESVAAPDPVAELAGIGIVKGAKFKTVHHGGSYVGPVEISAVGVVAGEAVLVLKDDGTEKFHLVPWRHVERVSTGETKP